jgi:DNA-binding MarR family transcriptional regulator
MQAAPNPVEAANDGVASSFEAVAVLAETGSPVPVCELLERVSSRLRTGLDAGLEPMAIDTRHFRIAVLLRDAGPQSQVWLCDRTRVDRASMVKLVDRLQEEGWVTREPCLADRRQNAVTLSMRGRKSLKAAETIAQHNEDHVLGALAPSQRAALQDLLRVVDSAAN